MLSDICHDVEIEPHLQPLQGQTFAFKSTTADDDDARIDIKANRLWESRFNKSYFDIKIFNPPANICHGSSNEAYNYHESIRKNKYEQRITEVEKESFCLLVFACTGEAGLSASKALKQLASKLSARKEDNSWIYINLNQTSYQPPNTNVSFFCKSGIIDCKI